MKTNSIDNNVVYTCHAVIYKQELIRYCNYRVYYEVYKDVLRRVELDIHNALCKEIVTELYQKHE
jgi:hypothetical protein